MFYAFLMRRFVLKAVRGGLAFTSVQSPEYYMQGAKSAGSEITALMEPNSPP
jgi:hypothetical protein